MTLDNTLNEVSIFITIKGEWSAQHELRWRLPVTVELGVNTWNRIGNGPRLG